MFAAAVCVCLQPDWRGEVIPVAWSPRAFHIKQLLTDEECEHIKRIVGRHIMLCCACSTRTQHLLLLAGVAVHMLVKRREQLKHVPSRCNCDWTCIGREQVQLTWQKTKLVTQATRQQLVGSPSMVPAPPP
eukprot:GHRQ01023426.1.p1 GENE.GHRQ01023426.1~~GHRQ01023426.1.p1  ORF type:complete len:131 (+),score=7.54 GHRQ01023426.1:459-851(+)